MEVHVFMYLATYFGAGTAVQCYSTLAYFADALSKAFSLRLNPLP